MKLRISQGEVHGEDVFKLMDSRGLPLELLAEAFRYVVSDREKWKEFNDRLDRAYDTQRRV